MNRRVFISMLILTMTILAVNYVLKIFFPQEFVLCVENENIVRVGAWIDEHRFAYFIVGTLCGIGSDYLFFGAVLRQRALGKLPLIIILAYNIVCGALSTFLPPSVLAKHSNLFVAISTIYMIATPLLFTKELMPLSITYCVTTVSQLLSLTIRNIAMLLTNANTLSCLLLSLDAYIWLFVCFIIFNYKEVKNNGSLG